MLNEDPRGPRAPRDIVARGIQKQIQKQKEKFVWLDGSSIPKTIWKSRFPNIYKTCSSIGIQLPQDPIPVVPAAHYFCGGIKVNQYSESQLKGLYAIGECSNTGLHGANRLASNSLLEALVFSHRAALASQKELAEIEVTQHFFGTIPDWNDAFTVSNKESKLVDKLCKEIQETMSSCVGIFKSEESLLVAEKKLNTLFRAQNRPSILSIHQCNIRN